jgi:hypothetical protein
MAGYPRTGGEVVVFREAKEVDERRKKENGCQEEDS